MTLTRNNSTIRQYRPNVGELIGMSQFSDYTSRGLSPWGRLRVIGIDADTVTVKHAPHPMDATFDDPSPITIPLYTVSVPLGWEPRYTIYCSPEQSDKIIGDWFKRGISVRANHDLGSCMSIGSAFQPLDNSDTPHWRYPEQTDVISAEDCPRLFKVIAVTVQEITSELLGYPADPTCNHCQGTGRRSIAHLASVRKESPETTRANVQSGAIQVEDYSYASDTFRCHCHYGAMSRMGRTKRAKLIKQMRANGWQVEYRPYAGGFWERRKETLVHDWTV